MTCRLWYLERDGSRAAGTVASVDSSIQPPSYAVRIDKSDSIRYPSSPSTAVLHDDNAEPWLPESFSHPSMVHLGCEMS